MGKKAAKRQKAIDSRLQQTSAAPDGAPDSGEDCPACREHVDQALARAKETSALWRTIPPAPDDPRDQIIGQAILGDLSTAAVQFRETLTRADAVTSEALQELRTVRAELERALEAVRAAALAEAARAEAAGAEAAHAEAAGAELARAQLARAEHARTGLASTGLAGDDGLDEEAVAALQLGFAPPARQQVGSSNHQHATGVNLQDVTGLNHA